jgi:methionyl-tRNA formyltransferase
LQPTNLKDPTFISDVTGWEADVFIVVAFRMLPEAVWNTPQFGTINLHASLLPQLRGAAPIQWAIINGLESSGVSTFSLQHQIDTGDILLQKTVPIAPDDDAGLLYDKLLQAGSPLLVQTLDALTAGRLKPMPQGKAEQGESRLEAPKLNKENTLIKWTESTVNVINKVRGLNPFPKAWTPSAHGDLKLLKASLVSEDARLPSQVEPGTVALHAHAMVVRCSDGWIQVDALVPPGKGRMSGVAWLNGLKTEIGQLG